MVLVSVLQIIPRSKSPENVKFKLDGVGGPSAGLMFTLAIYDQVSGQDLKGWS